MTQEYWIRFSMKRQKQLERRLWALLYTLMGFVLVGIGALVWLA